MKEKKNGFTLAEVLITLVIIGVIAALTVPTIMTNVRQQEYIQRLKKMYSVLSQAHRLAVSNDGPMQDWVITGTSDDATDSFVKTYILPYLIKAQDCGRTSEDACKFEYRWMNEPNKKYWADDWYKIILNDGSTVIFRTEISNPNLIFTLATVDVNGDANPNVFGRDIYTFVYWLNNPSADRREKFEAYGIDWSRDMLVSIGGSNACNKSSSGQLCAALLMQDNWQMKFDYPR